MATGIATPYRDPRTAYGRRIPVGEATELAGIPPEMQPPRAAAAAPAAGGIAEMPPQRLLQRAAGAAGPVAKTAAIGAVPAIAAMALRSGADNGSSPTPPTPVGLGDIPRGIPGGIASPPAERPPFFAQSEAGRNIANAVMAIPGASGVARSIAALPRIAAQIPTTAGKVAQAAPVAADMVRGTVMADAAMGNVAAPAAASSPARDQLPNALNQPAAEGQPGVRPSAASDYGMSPRSPAAQLVDGEVARRGNLYEGINVKENFNWGGAGPRSTNGSGQLSVVPGYFQGGENSAAAIDKRANNIAEQTQLMRAGLLDKGDMYAYASRDGQILAPAPAGGFGSGDTGYGLESKNAIQRRELQMATTSSKSNLESQRAYETRIAGAAKSLAEFDEASFKRPGEREANANRMDIARLQADSQRGIADIQGRTQRDVAAMAADSRMSAAEANANARAAAAEAAARRFIPVAGGQQVLEIGGLPTTVTQPSRVFDSTRGVYVDPPAPQGGKPAMTQAPKAGEVRSGYRYMGGDPALPESWKKVA